jgi:fructose-specific phosphotransferase system IIC component
MRASLTSPALTAWVIVGVAICLVWRVDWHIGVLGGFVAAALVYWLWRLLKPRVALAPDWLWSLIFSAIVAGITWLWLSESPTSLFGWFYLLLAFSHFDRGVWDYLHRHEPKKGPTE